MALFSCKECGREISDQSPACIGCGAPLAVAMGVPQAWVASEPPAGSPPPLNPSKAMGVASQSHRIAPSQSVTGQLTKAALVLVGLTVLGFLVLMVFDEGSSTSKPESAEVAAVDAEDVPDTPEVRQAKITSLAAEAVDASYSASARLARAELLIKQYPESPEAARARSFIADLQAEAEEAKRGQQWSYSTFSDSMSGKQGSSARVTSTNSFEFDFPYQGRQHATLTVRRHPRWGNDVIFSVEKGQILCGISECEVEVRFDDGPARTFSANEPADNSTESIFLPASAFTKAMQKAKVVRIQVHMFQQGVLTAEFDVDGFKPERLEQQ